MWQPTHVKVTIKQAQNILIKGKNGTNDAFVVIGIGKEKFQTSIKEKSLPDVEWREECELEIPSQGNKAGLQLTVYHRNNLGLDDFLGQVYVPLTDFDVYDRPKYRWYTLKGKPEKDRKKGEKERGRLEAMFNFTVKADHDANKKEKHKSSLSSLKHLGGSLMSLRSKEKQGLKQFAASVSQKMDKLGRGKKVRKSKTSNDKHDPQIINDWNDHNRYYGDADPGVVSDDDDFRFEDDIKISTRTSSPMSTISRESSVLQEQQNTNFERDFQRSFFENSFLSKSPPSKMLHVTDDSKQDSPRKLSEKYTSFSDPVSSVAFSKLKVPTPEPIYEEDSDLIASERDTALIDKNYTDLSRHAVEPIYEEDINSNKRKTEPIYEEQLDDFDKKSKVKDSPKIFIGQNENSKVVEKEKNFFSARNVAERATVDSNALTGFKKLRRPAPQPPQDQDGCKIDVHASSPRYSPVHLNSEFKVDAKVEISAIKTIDPKSGAENFSEAPKKPKRLATENKNNVLINVPEIIEKESSKYKFKKLQDSKAEVNLEKCDTEQQNGNKEFENPFQDFKNPFPDSNNPFENSKDSFEDPFQESKNSFEDTKNPFEDALNDQALNFDSGDHPAVENFSRSPRPIRIKGPKKVLGINSPVSSLVKSDISRFSNSLKSDSSKSVSSKTDSHESIPSQSETSKPKPLIVEVSKNTILSEPPKSSELKSESPKSHFNLGLFKKSLKVPKLLRKSNSDLDLHGDEKNLSDLEKSSSLNTRKLSIGNQSSDHGLFSTVLRNRKSDYTKDRKSELQKRKSVADFDFELNRVGPINRSGSLQEKKKIELAKADESFKSDSVRNINLAGMEKNSESDGGEHHPPAITIIDDWERKLYGRSVAGSTESMNRSESRSSLNTATSRENSCHDIKRDESFTRLPEVKALILEENDSEFNVKKEKKKNKETKVAKGFKSRFFRHKDESLSEFRIVEGGNDTLPRMPSAVSRSLKLPQEVYDKYAGKSREDLLELILNLQSGLESEKKHSSELENYIDNLLLRVMEATPHLLQHPVGGKSSRFRF